MMKSITSRSVTISGVLAVSLLAGCQSGKEPGSEGASAAPTGGASRSPSPWNGLATTPTDSPIPLRRSSRW
ncbi:hypothetical protein N6H14_15760 [Paenibacillus sp. CC-CFT747]|nr:hypothetical protein N6H14_15760 [Paenibacillus sp. CC-CFT747]